VTGRRHLACAVFLAAWQAAEARAADGPGDDPLARAPPAPAPTPSRLRPSFEWCFPASLPDDGGDVSAARLRFDVDVRSRSSSTLRARWRGAAEHSWYRIDDPAALAPGTGDLLDRATLLRFAPLLELRLASGWGADLGPIVQSTGAPGATFEDTLTYGVEASVRFPLGSRRRAGVGARLEQRLEDPAEILPVLHLEGGGVGRWSLESLGTGVRLAYAPSPCWAVGASVRRDRRDVRLAPGARVPEGVFRDQRWLVGADVAWRPQPSGEARVGLWRTVDHRVVVDDRDGNVVTDVDLAPSWQLGVALTFEF
jgi:hypothetical protein